MYVWLHLCYNQLLSKLKLKTRTSYVAVSGTPGNPGCTVHGLTQGEVRYLQVFNIHPPSWIHNFLGIHVLGNTLLGYTILLDYTLSIHFHGPSLSHPHPLHIILLSQSCTEFPN